jgi:hypothetical protein
MGHGQEVLDKMLPRDNGVAKLADGGMLRWQVNR